MTDSNAPTDVQPGVTQGFEAAALAAEKPEEVTPGEPAATGEGAAKGEDAQEPQVPSTYEEWESSERHQTSLTGARTAAVEEAKSDIHREAKAAAMREFTPSHDRAEAYLGDLAKTGQGMGRSLRDAIENATESGGDAKQMQRALQRVIDDNPGFIEMVNSSMHSSGMDSALRKLADEAGDPHLLSDVYLRLKNDPGMGDKGFAREMLDRLTEARIKDSFISKEASDKALGAKDKEIASLKAALNQDKGKVRAEGPEKLPGSAGGSKDINKARRDYADGKTNVYPG